MAKFKPSGIKRRGKVSNALYTCLVTTVISTLTNKVLPLNMVIAMWSRSMTHESNANLGITIRRVVYLIRDDSDITTIGVVAWSRKPNTKTASDPKPPVLFGMGMTDSHISNCPMVGGTATVMTR